jgi:ribosomal protein S18 acetylase RimI-like enzyme
VTKPFAFELLGKRHKRAAFSCGVEPLDRYFQQQVTQDVRRLATACYVAIEVASSRIAGYYTLAAGAVLLSGLPPELAKKLPRYPDVPVARLGRLAIDLGFQRRKLGAAMLWDAVLRAKRSEVAVYGLVVDAKDDNAVAFYEHHGFTMLSVGERQLVLPLAGIHP